VPSTPSKPKRLSGPASLFRGKVRMPISLTLQPEHHAILRRATARLGLTRADTIALLIHMYAASLTVDDVRRVDGGSR
jgi:hypothetical protein